MKEYDFEPIRGLPEHLPPGEEMLWQGAPRWNFLARRAFHVRKIAVYFALLAVWYVVTDWSKDSSVTHALTGILWIAALAAVSIGALMLLAWGMSRSTVYTITSQRVVMRFGVAIAMIINLPFAQIRSADVRRYADGSGDIPLQMARSARISYLIFWPHVRPWHWSPPQPMLRAIPDVDTVAEILGNALKQFAEQSVDPAGDPDAGTVSAETLSASHSASVS